MAHSTPPAGVPGRAPRPLTAAPRRRRTGTAAWVVPLLFGAVYGTWAAEIRRSTPSPGPITAGNVVFGVVSGLVVAVLAVLLHRLPRRLMPELRAGAWAAFAGAAFGWIYSLSDAPLFRTVVIALLTAGGTFVLLWYRYHTREVPPDTYRYYAADPRRDRRIGS